MTMNHISNEELKKALQNDLEKIKAKGGVDKLHAKDGYKGHLPNMNGKEQKSAPDAEEQKQNSAPVIYINRKERIARAREAKSGNTPFNSQNTHSIPSKAKTAYAKQASAKKPFINRKERIARAREAKAANNVASISKAKEDNQKSNVQNEPKAHLAVIKTNYVKSDNAGKMASESVGYGASHGTSNAKSTADFAKSAGSYQNRNGALSESQIAEKAKLEKETGQKQSNTYNRDGVRMTKSEYKAYQTKLANSDINGMRRIMISPDPKLGFSTDEMVSITRDTMQNWQEASGKQFNFTFAVHDGQSELHSHVTMTSQDANAVNMQSKQLETFKNCVDNAIQNQLDIRQDLSKVENLAKAERLTVEKSLENASEISIVKEVAKEEGFVLVL